MRRLAAVALVLCGFVCASCGGASPAPAPATEAPPTREMAFTLSGGLTGKVTVTPDARVAICAGHLANEPGSLNYVFQLQVEGIQAAGIQINFSIHGGRKPGRYSVGPYPAGAKNAPAIGVLVEEVTPRDIRTWVSGSGTLLIDAGLKSGTVDLKLLSDKGLPDLGFAGSWTCN